MELLIDHGIYLNLIDRRAPHSLLQIACEFSVSFFRVYFKSLSAVVERLKTFTNKTGQAQGTHLRKENDDF